MCGWCLFAYNISAMELIFIIIYLQTTAPLPIVQLLEARSSDVLCYNHTDTDTYDDYTSNEHLLVVSVAQD